VWCPFIQERGSGPAILEPYSFWPRDQVRKEGPLNLSEGEGVSRSRGGSRDRCTRSSSSRTAAVAAGLSPVADGGVIEAKLLEDLVPETILKSTAEIT